MADPFDNNEYVFYKYAGAVEVFDGNGNSILYAEREGAIKLGKPIHVYTNKYRTDELLTISSPRGSKEIVYLRWPITLPGMEYRVIDAKTGREIGSVVQKNLIRITRDDWLLNTRGEIVGRLESIGYIAHSLIWPKHYRIVTGESEIVGSFRQTRDVLNFKFVMTIDHGEIDTRLLVSAGIIIATLTATF